jgi:hypothetical protein
MGGTYNTHVEIRNAYKMLTAKTATEEAYLGGLEFDGRTIINWV